MGLQFIGCFSFLIWFSDRYTDFDNISDERTSTFRKMITLPTICPHDSSHLITPSSQVSSNYSNVLEQQRTSRSNFFLYWSEQCTSKYEYNTSHIDFLSSIMEYKKISKIIIATSIHTHAMLPSSSSSSSSLLCDLSTISTIVSDQKLEIRTRNCRFAVENQYLRSSTAGARWADVPR